MKKALILFVSTAFLTGCLDKALPKCDSNNANKFLEKSINKEILKEELGVKGELEYLTAMIGEDKDRKPSVYFVSANNVREIKFDEGQQIRTCRADIALSNGEQAKDVGYLIEYTSQKKKDFRVVLEK